MGLDKTGVVARVTGFLFEQRANIEVLEEQVAAGQKLEAKTLVKGVKLYLNKKLNVSCDVVKEV